MLCFFLPNPQRVSHRSILLGSLLLFLLLCQEPAAQAAGVVATPTQAALHTALMGGGSVTFACDGVIPFTRAEVITTDTFIDATGHNITFDGGNRTSLFYVNGLGQNPTFTLCNLTLINGKGGVVPFGVGGGAIYATDTYLLATNCTFLANTATGNSAISTAYGGAVYIDSTSPPFSVASFNHCKFINNSALGGNNTNGGWTTAAGGAILTLDTTTLVVNSVFLNNTAQAGSAYGSTSTAYGSSSGGAIASSETLTTASIDISDTTFWGNKAIGGINYTGGGGDANGGAFAVSDTTNLTRCTFAYNSVIGNSGVAGSGGNAYGGAFAYASNKSLNLTLCTVSNNQAIGGNASSTGYSSGYAYGGGVKVSSGTVIPVIQRCTIVNNSAMAGTVGSSVIAQGGGIYNSNNPVTFYNTILANNMVSNSSNNIYGSLTDGGGNLSSDATFTDPTSKSNMDPRLAPLATNGGLTPTRALLPGSPAIDASNTINNSNPPIFDQRGYDGLSVGALDIGAYERPKWQADASATAPDGTTRLLWNRKDGLCNLWSVDAGGNVVQSFNFGPFPGWAAIALSVGADNNTRLLWQNSSGAVNVWNVDTSTGSGTVLASVHYGPFAGWTLNSLTTGTDNHTRLLWLNIDGHIDLWNVDTGSGTDAATILSSSHYGPYAGWTATALAVGSDNSTHLLWTNFDGRANVWNVATGAGVDAATILSSAHYGPYPGWTATTLSVGADNNTRLLWNQVDGTINLWNLQIGAGVDNSVLLSSPMYGPFADFGCNVLSVGGDNQTRFLWNHIDGMLDLWRVNAGGGLLSSFHFGPF